MTGEQWPDGCYPVAKLNIGSPADVRDVLIYVHGQVKVDSEGTRILTRGDRYLTMRLLSLF